MYTYLHTCIHTHTHVYIHIHMYTYTHMYAHTGVSKGTAVKHILSGLPSDWPTPDLVLCIGDDVADELMFTQLVETLSETDDCQVCVYVCVCICMRVYMYVYMCIYVWVLGIYVCV